MRFDQMEQQPDRHKARRWSLMLALAAHALVLGGALHVWSHGIHSMALNAAKPILHGELMDTRSLPPVEATSVSADAEVGALDIEPDARLVRSMAQRIVGNPVETQNLSLGDVRAKAELLERISNADEIQKMASHLRDALGADLDAIEMTDADAPPVDWNQALPVSAERIAQADSLEVREVYTDPQGGRTVMIHTRRRIADESFEYTTSFFERGERGLPIESTREEFEAALARIEPIEMMQEFPLLRELHRSAILPILHKMVEEYEADERAQRGKPSAVATPQSDMGRGTGATESHR